MLVGLKKETIVVVGLGMVGLRFIEKIIELDPTRQMFTIIAFCEEVTNY
jgi:NAD(P)H-nitrite reductase large subunit